MKKNILGIISEACPSLLEIEAHEDVDENYVGGLVASLREMADEIEANPNEAKAVVACYVCDVEGSSKNGSTIMVGSKPACAVATEVILRESGTLQEAIRSQTKSKSSLTAMLEEVLNG